MTQKYHHRLSRFFILGTELYKHVYLIFLLAGMYWLFTAACLTVRFVEHQEPQETSVYAAYSAVGFAGTLDLLTAHCCNFPAQTAQKKI